MAVAAAHVDGSIHNGRRRLEADLIVCDRVLAGLVAPFLLPGFGIQRIEIAVPASNVDRVVSDGGGGVDDIVGGEFPNEDTRMRIQGVDVSVP